MIDWERFWEKVAVGERVVKSAQRSVNDSAIVDK